MRCRSCRADNPNGNRFCESCGSALQLTCARCGHEVGAGARFCGNCGNTVSAAPAIAGEAAPKWGELKQATVLFADIVGSTDLVAHMDAEQAMSQLGPAVQRMRQSVERFGGTVMRTLGDGVMAMFGVPLALEGHALLACQAALHMQAAFHQSTDGLQIRVGLHSGQVASDPEDAEGGRGGGAHGVTIHLASRVIALAPPGGICVTDAVRVSAGAGCATEPMGPHQLKGIPLPVEIYRLTGAVSTAPHRPLTPETTFRGREGELAQLVSALDAAQARRGGTVGVSGDPGAGKSRLCREFADICGKRGVPVYEVRAQLYGHALPLQPVLELFRVHFFGITPSDDTAAAREGIERRFASVGVSAEDLRLLYEFFGVSEPDAVPLALGPRTRQSRLLALVRSLVRHESSAERVILIEDLHWLDEASEQFVSALVDAVVGTSTLLLLNYRLAYQAPWAGLPHFAQLNLAELDAEHMKALVAELLAPVTALPDICELICARASGNPFFAEELVRTLAESDLLSADTGLPEGGLEAVEKALPPTVEAVIGARLDRIGEPEKSLLQMCAIIGKEIPLAVLEHVATPLASHIQVGLEGLCRAGLILPQPADGGRRFAFRHPLIQEVAYSTQLKVRRSVVHANVAAAMELYYAEQLDEYAALIGYHYEEAGQPLQGATYYERAATWVGALHAAQAIRHWRKARALLASAARSEEVDRRRATAGAKIATLGWREGLSHAEVKPLIDEALQFANKGDDRLVPWLLTIDGRMLVASGGPADTYVDLVKKALLYIDVDRDPGRLAAAHVFMCQAYSWAGLLQEALDASDVALRLAHHVDPFDREFFGFSLEQWILSLRARIFSRMARTGDARACLEALLELEATSREPPVPGMSHTGFVELAWAQAEAAVAEEHAREFLHIADKNGAPYVKVFANGYSGIAASLASNPTLALRRFETALELVRSTGAAREFEPELLAGLAEAQLRLGDAEGAYARSCEAIELSRQRTTRVAECRALIVRSESAHACGRDGGAEDLAAAKALLETTHAFALRPAWERARAVSVARTA